MQSNRKCYVRCSLEGIAEHSFRWFVCVCVKESERGQGTVPNTRRHSSSAMTSSPSQPTKTYRLNSSSFHMLCMHYHPRTRKSTALTALIVNMKVLLPLLDCFGNKNGFVVFAKIFMQVHPT